MNSLFSIFIVQKITALQIIHINRRNENGGYQKDTVQDKAYILSYVIMMQELIIVHHCWTPMTMIVKGYILFGTLQYTDYMICLGQPIPGFLTHIASASHVNLNLQC